MGGNLWEGIFGSKFSGVRFSGMSFPGVVGTQRASFHYLTFDVKNDWSSFSLNPTKLIEIASPCL